MIIETPAKKIEGMGLAPVAVLPEFQHQGIGTGLIQLGLESVKNQGSSFVVVLGHPTYYSRFGFIRASHYNEELIFLGGTR